MDLTKRNFFGHSLNRQIWSSFRTVGIWWVTQGFCYRKWHECGAINDFVTETLEVVLRPLKDLIIGSILAKDLGHGVHVVDEILQIPAQYRLPDDIFFAFFKGIFSNKLQLWEKLAVCHLSWVNWNCTHNQFKSTKVNPSRIYKRWPPLFWSHFRRTLLPSFQRGFIKLDF